MWLIVLLGISDREISSWKNTIFSSEGHLLKLLAKKYCNYSVACDGWLVSLSRQREE